MVRIMCQFWRGNQLLSDAEREEAALGPITEKMRHHIEREAGKLGELVGEYDRLSSLRSEVGKLGGRPKAKANQKESKHKAKEVEVRVGVTVEEGRGSRQERARDERFEALWVVFERHGSKGKALTYWGRLSEEDKVAIEAKAPEYVRSTPGAEYRKHLDGWINPDERRWEAPVVFKVVPIAKPVDITYAQAKQELEAIRASRGIAPGGYIESHLIPAHISKAMQRG